MPPRKKKHPPCLLSFIDNTNSAIIPVLFIDHTQIQLSVDVILFYHSYYFAVFMTECERRRQIAIRTTLIVGHVTPPEQDMYLPKCSEDGSFYPTQCWDSKGYCWCVDKDGNEMQNTRSPTNNLECRSGKFNLLNSI